jgi:hypothetical protein
VPAAGDLEKIRPVTTAEALDGMTDESAFELLAVRSLRKLEPDCHSLVHLGMNSQGKTIRNPIDGFCLVPNSMPPRYVMVAATTSSSKALKSKWLTDGKPSKPKSGRASKKNTKGNGLKSEPGDIPKAILEASSVRAQVCERRKTALVPSECVI